MGKVIFQYFKDQMHFMSIPVNFTLKLNGNTIMPKLLKIFLHSCCSLLKISLVFDVYILNKQIFIWFNLFYILFGKKIMKRCSKKKNKNILHLKICLMSNDKTLFLNDFHNIFHTFSFCQKENLKFYIPNVYRHYLTVYKHFHFK